MLRTCRICFGRGYTNYSAGPDSTCDACNGTGSIYTVRSAPNTHSKPGRAAWWRRLIYEVRVWLLKRSL